MRGAYYVAIALLVVGSCRADEELGVPTQLISFNYGVIAAEKSADKAPAKRFLRESRNGHDNLAHTAAIEERTNPFRPILIKEAGRTRFAAVPANAERNVSALKAALTKAVEDLIKLQRKPTDDAAAVAEASFNPLSGELAPKPSSWWDNEINMHPEITVAGQSNTLNTQEHNALTSDMKEQSSRTSTDKNMRALAPSRNQIPREAGHSRKHDSKKLEATHDVFLTVAGESHNPTIGETSVLWGMINWKTSAKSLTGIRLINIERLAKHDVIREMVSLLEEDKMWEKWVFVTHSQRVEILDNLLKKHVQRWSEMYNMFYQAKPHIPDPDPKTKAFRASLGKSTSSTKPSLDDRISRSSNKAPSAHMDLQNSHLAEPISSELTTIDLLSRLGKRTHSSLDESIGTSNYQVPSGGVQSKKPRLIKPPSSKLTTKDFLRHFG